MTDIINKRKAQLHTCMSANVTPHTLRAVYLCVSYLTRVRKQNVIMHTDA